MRSIRLQSRQLAPLIRDIEQDAEIHRNRLETANMVEAVQLRTQLQQCDLLLQWLVSNGGFIRREETHQISLLLEFANKRIRRYGDLEDRHLLNANRSQYSQRLRYRTLVERLQSLT